MNQKQLLMGFGVVLFLFAGNAATQEYTRIKTRLEATQAKVDKLTDELAATTKTIHAAIKSLAERFAKQSFEVVDHKTSEPIKTLEPPSKAVIVMHSADSCGPCKAWIRDELAKWKSVGWDVQVVKEIETKRGWPWYEITDRDGKRFEVDGALTTEKFQIAKRKTE
jgi:outer membrane murein-binding lipoprotein Lpp